MEPSSSSVPMDPLFFKDPWYKDVIDDYREMQPSEVKDGYDSGCQFTSVCLNTAIYLAWLVGQCRKNGVEFKRAVLSDLSEAKSLSHTGRPADIIINATGLGSFKLGGVEDKTMTPARAQTVLVRNECSPMLVTSGTDDGVTEILYVMQRAAGGGTILGGTYDMGNWESQPDPNIANRIMERIVKLHPQIADGKGVKGLSVIRHGVGLRPFRADGVRLETERMSDGTHIVHNYGHAGWGYQGSYGCAEEVVNLVNKIRASKGESLAGEPQLFAWDKGSVAKAKL